MEGVGRFRIQDLFVKESLSLLDDVGGDSDVFAAQSSLVEVELHSLVVLSPMGTAHCQQ